MKIFLAILCGAVIFLGMTGVARAETIHGWEISIPEWYAWPWLTLPPWPAGWVSVGAVDSITFRTQSITPLDYDRNPRPVVMTAHRQELFHAGDVFSGLMTFGNGDYIWNDRAWSKVYDSTGNEIARLIYAQSGDPGFILAEGQTHYMEYRGWGTLSIYGPFSWGWTATQPGWYTLEVAVMADDAFSSAAYFTGMKFPSLPEPSLLLLVGSGLAALFAFRRKFI